MMPGTRVAQVVMVVVAVVVILGLVVSAIAAPLF
jgi:hypothetical protein